MGVLIVKPKPNLFRYPVTDIYYDETIEPTVSTFGDVGVGTNKWQGVALAHNGKIYCAPLSENKVLVIDPTNDSFYYIDVTSGGYRGACLSPNGKIYCIPHLAGVSNILVINPTNDTFYRINASIASHGSGSYIGGCIAPNGAIYCFPAQAPQILKIDTLTDTVTTIGSNLGTAAFKYGSGAMTVDGKIVMNPTFAEFPLLVDPSDDSVTTFVQGDGAANKAYSCVLAKDGLMYSMGWQAAKLRLLNPGTGEYTTILSGLPDESFIWGVLGMNGLIYGCPGSTSRVIEVNPYVPSWRYVGADIAGSIPKYGGCVMARNGNIYGVPRGGSTICKISFGQQHANPHLLSAYVNR